MRRFSQILLTFALYGLFAVCAQAQITFSLGYDISSSISGYSYDSSTVFQAVNTGSYSLTTPPVSACTLQFIGLTATLQSTTTSFAGQFVVGDGTNSSNLTLTSTNFSTSGTLLINNASTLNLGSTPLSLVGAGNLSGAGMIMLDASGRILFSSGATGGLSPGNNAIDSIGCLTLNTSGTSGSTLQLTSSSTSTFDIASGASYDQVNLGGTNVVYSGQLVLNFTSAPSAGSTYQLFKNNGTTTDTFSSITSNLDGGYTFSFDESLGLLTIETIPEPSIVWILGLALFSFVLTQTLRKKFAIRAQS